ncbi:undecaprenyldiphospho-muramoylpentapeptide beta-N- acetylglucosaminyltransferase [Planctomycetes bacterium Pan216]|uniref:Undecaprenyldiphospho-muramoylpentapeptide beta-N-acetylglucosaminyltransferase n=1 Tax=Kolteria novifilia TaxID=2527975 RepID=A0A518B0S8_9BACT|nr:undecaprenyldiphospho-muramoylpentapeptide beta-N- acetylglucosaminyltransferase [Planctomycetes bacterium Pan216]
MNRGNILLRVDGSAHEGLGRVARCLALANALQRRRYQMTFISQIDNHSWPDRVRRFRHAVVRTQTGAGSQDDREQLMREINSRNPVVVITDSPDIDESYLAEVSSRVPLVINLDDAAKRSFSSDVVINPLMGHTVDDYRLAPGTQLLSGQRYAMIRSEFRRARSVRGTEPGGPTRALVALGAGEVVQDTTRVAKALLKTKQIERVDAVIGTGQEGRDELNELLEQFPDRLHIAPDVRDLGMRMSKSHLLVAGGGNTALEAACVGIPMILVSRHGYHAANADALEDVGCAYHMGGHDKFEPGRIAETAIMILEDKFERKTMSRSGRMLIDGRGPDRLVTVTEILLRRSRQYKQVLAAAA